MKKQVVINGFIYASKPENFELDLGGVIDGVKYTFMTYGGLTGKYMLVCPHTLVFEVEHDPKEEFVKAIELEKATAFENYNSRIMELDSQLITLLNKTE